MASLIGTIEFTTGLLTDEQFAKVEKAIDAQLGDAFVLLRTTEVRVVGPADGRGGIVFVQRTISMVGIPVSRGLLHCCCCC